MNLEQKNIPIHLKKATPADIPVLLEIEKSVSDLNGAAIYSSLTVVTAEDWKKQLQKYEVYLIEKDGNIVGFISYEYKNKDHVYIDDFAIDSRFQGQGIGRAVLSGILEELKDCRRIDLVTHPDNKVALSLYKSLGFTVESRQENYCGDGRPQLILALERK